MQEYLKSVPPSLAYFSLEEPDTVVYTGYGLHKYIQLYSITQGKVRVALCTLDSSLCERHNVRYQPHVTTPLLGF